MSEQHHLELTDVFVRTYRELGRREAEPQIHATFYPFSTLRHNIRRRGDRLVARVSDILQAAPEEILECVAHILFGKLFRLRIKAEYRNIYWAYALDEEVDRRIIDVQRLRSRKIYGDGNGSMYDLQGAFDRLNRQYFDGQISVAHIGWTQHQAKSRLGFFDEIRNRIVISRLLDHAQVPPAVFEYVLYHEMLHTVHKAQIRHGRRCVHYDEFRRDEMKFLHYSEAKQFLAGWGAPAKGARRI
ncbi:MAG: M48 family metallopeptidase [Acidobacteria bacterium]|nr:M48 family metallopeptidase [Acidobacteriota bacterium]